MRRSRDRQREKFRNCQQQRDQLQRELEQQRRQVEHEQQRIEQLQAELDAQRQSAREPDLWNIEDLPFFDDPPVGSHGFGARMIALTIQLVQAGLGLRAVERALTIIFRTLGIQRKVPDWSTIRLWMLRLGHALLIEPAASEKDWVWLTDHSVQIGREKVLVILGVRQAHLPPRGQALRHEDVRVLAVLPRTSWTQPEVHQALRETAAKHGVPRAIVSDHGVDLLGGIELFRQHHPEVLELYDFKHKAACRLKALLEKDPQYQEFHRRVGQTRCAIQQTELGFLTPPAHKEKARFMNVGPFLEWGQKLLRLLDHPAPKARRWVSEQRLEEKLGWLRDYRECLAEWSACQQVIDAGVTFANQHGVFREAAQQLAQVVATPRRGAASGKLADELVAFVQAEESKLKDSERMPLSTELVESSFAKYKNLERQHSKSGFTSLVLAFGALLAKVTPERIRECFATNCVRDVRQWVRDQLGETLASKRKSTYRECKPPPRATKLANVA